VFGVEEDSEREEKGRGHPGTGERKPPGCSIFERVSFDCTRWSGARKKGIGERLRSISFA